MNAASNFFSVLSQHKVFHINNLHNYSFCRTFLATMKKNALDLRQISADVLWDYAALSEMSARNIKVARVSALPAARMHEDMTLQRLVFSYMAVLKDTHIEDNLGDELLHRAGFNSSEEDEDEKGEGKKEGSAKVEEMHKGRLPLEFLVKYLIKKNRPEKAFRLMIKAMERARTPAKMAEIMGVAHVAVEELKAMQYWEDIKQIKNYILIGSAPTGTCMHSTSALTARMLDFDLMTSASIPRSYAVKEAGHYYIEPQGLRGSFATNSWDSKKVSMWGSGFQRGDISCDSVVSEIGEGFQLSFTRSNALRSISDFYGEFSKNNAVLPINASQIPTFETIAKHDEFAYSQPNLVVLDMVSDIARREGTNGVISSDFMRVSYVSNEASYSAVRTDHQSDNEQIEVLAHEGGWNPADIDTLLKGGLKDLERALNELQSSLGKMDADNLKNISHTMHVAYNILRAFEDENSLDSHAMGSFKSTIEELLESLEVGPDFLGLQDTDKIMRMENDGGSFWFESQMTAIKAASDSLESFQRELESFFERKKDMSGPEQSAMQLSAPSLAA